VGYIRVTYESSRGVRVWSEASVIVAVCVTSEGLRSTWWTLFETVNRIRNPRVAGEAVQANVTIYCGGQ
jgi:hypothetical protein